MDLHASSAEATDPLRDLGCECSGDDENDVGDNDEVDDHDHDF